MITGLRSAVDALRAVRRDTRAWVHHLTGEGPATVQRQRQAVAQTLTAAPPASVARRASPGEMAGARRAPATAGTPRRRLILGTR
jgi:hypothetical protein